MLNIKDTHTDSAFKIIYAGIPDADRGCFLWITKSFISHTIEFLFVAKTVKDFQHKK